MAWVGPVKVDPRFDFEDEEVKKLWNSGKFEEAYKNAYKRAFSRTQQIAKNYSNSKAKTDPMRYLTSEKPYTPVTSKNKRRSL